MSDPHPTIPRRRRRWLNRNGGPVLLACLVLVVALLALTMRHLVH